MPFAVLITADPTVLTFQNSIFQYETTAVMATPIHFYDPNGQESIFKNFMTAIL